MFVDIARNRKNKKLLYATIYFYVFHNKIYTEIVIFCIEFNVVAMLIEVVRAVLFKLKTIIIIIKN